MSAVTSLNVLRLKFQDRLARKTKRFMRPLWMQRLDAANRDSSRSVVATGGPVVSLTTHSRRLDLVYYTIESIAAGKLRPSRLVLWIDAALLAHGLPETLRRLIRRGLEVRGGRDYGPHTKYFPQINADTACQTLVTADDDVLYPSHWLRTLQRAAVDAPDQINCLRAHVIGLDANGQLTPYAEWKRCKSTRTSHLHFATGVAGIAYPASMQQALREAGTGFEACCPRADDVWINAIALRNGIRVRQAQPVRARFYELPGTRDHGLARGNVHGGGNDRQLHATYTAADLAVLRAEREGMK